MTQVNGSSVPFVATAKSAKKEGFKVEPLSQLVNDALVKHGLTTKGSLADRCANLQSWFDRDEGSGVGHELAECSECGWASTEALPACAFCGHSAIVEDEEKLAGDESSALAKIAEDPVKAEQKLDRAMERVKLFTRAMAGSAWDVGAAIREIHEGRLYLARRAPGSKDPVHRTWDSFCRSELGWNPGYARTMIDIAANFTREEAMTVGAAKLGKILMVDGKQERARLLAKAPETSLRELTREVVEVASGQPPREKDRIGRSLGDHQRPGSNPQGAGILKANGPEYPPPQKLVGLMPKSKGKGKATADKPVEKAEARVLTLSAQEGEHEVHFYARAKSAVGGGRAKNIADKPRARMKMLNGTEIVITLHQGEKGIFGKVIVREVEEG